MPLRSYPKWSYKKGRAIRPPFTGSTQSYRKKVLPVTTFNERNMNRTNMYACKVDSKLNFDVTNVVNGNYATFSNNPMRNLVVSNASPTFNNLRDCFDQFRIRSI